MNFCVYIIINILTPVSYTHLDVYKRQTELNPFETSGTVAPHMYTNLIGKSTTSSRPLTCVRQNKMLRNSSNDRHATETVVNATSIYGWEFFHHRGP